MSYIGTPPSNAFTSLLKQDFSTSATTGYTLDHAVNNANDIALFINFVRQEPTAGYAASGTTLTLTSATASSDDMYCVYLGQALQTVNPANASVGLSQLTATGTKDATTFLRGDNTFASAGGTNTPAFEAFLSSSTNPSNNTETKIAFNSEVFDTNNCYDNSSNYRFTPTTAGKYYCYAVVRAGGGGNQSQTNFTAQFNKNGSEYGKEIIVQNGTSYPGNNYTLTLAASIDFNGSSDYLEVVGLINSTATGSFIGESCRFGAYKILT